ncbi:complex I NDUFA9 subunit family protein [Iodidimonas sp. SYSU 1G8]|uniref:complex I NDUFA9 subunit family protein n=1 Tax=Iodidimonas sp. SYSU 1G8 TaxID=3133967 RepID=UPI0031FF008A
MTRDLVTVIGGSGFIGRYVVRLLAQQHVRIRVAVRHPNQGLFLKPMGSVGQIQLTAANVRHPDSIARAVDGAGVVINLPGILYESGHQDFESVQAEGPGVVARAAAAAGVGRLVHVSAIGADADSESDYARTKAQGEYALRAAFPSATILRPSIVFGPEDDFFNRFAAMTRMPMPLPLIGGGKTRFQPVYVCDVAQAIVIAALEGKGLGETFELGGPRVYSFREILELVLAQTHRDKMMMPLPFGLAKIIGGLCQTLFALSPWNPPLTIDQVELLKHDNVVTSDRTLRDFGIDPTPAESVVGSYLQRFRKQGQFNKPAEAI